MHFCYKNNYYVLSFDKNLNKEIKPIFKEQ